MRPDGRRCQKKAGHSHGDCEAAVSRRARGDAASVAVESLAAGLSIEAAARRAGLSFEFLRDAVRAAETGDVEHDSFELGQRASVAIGEYDWLAAQAAIDSARNARLLFDRQKYLADTGGLDTSTAISDSEVWINLGLEIFGNMKDSDNARDNDSPSGNNSGNNYDSG